MSDEGSEVEGRKPGNNHGNDDEYFVAKYLLGAAMQAVKNDGYQSESSVEAVVRFLRLHPSMASRKFEFEEHCIDAYPLVYLLLMGASLEIAQEIYNLHPCAKILHHAIEDWEMNFHRYPLHVACEQSLDEEIVEICPEAVLEFDKGMNTCLYVGSFGLLDALATATSDSFEKLHITIFGGGATERNVQSMQQALKAFLSKISAGELILRAAENEFHLPEECPIFPVFYSLRDYGLGCWNGCDCGCIGDLTITGFKGVDAAQLCTWLQDPDECLPSYLTLKNLTITGGPWTRTGAPIEQAEVAARGLAYDIEDPGGVRELHLEKIVASEEQLSALMSVVANMALLQKLVISNLDTDITTPIKHLFRLNLLKELSLCDTTYDFPSLLEGLKTNNSLTKLWVPYDKSVAEPLKELLENHNTTLNSIGHGRIDLRKSFLIGFRKVRFYLQLNSFGRQEARDPTTSVDGFVELLCNVSESEGFIECFKVDMYYGLLQESTARVWALPD